MSGLLLPYKGVSPKVDETAYIAETATVIGDVEIGPESSIWFGCTVRGDVDIIRIGARSNLQDGTVIHVTTNTYPTIIGDDVTVGHRVLLHGCRLESGSFVGMGAIVMDDAVVEGGGMVAAGALVPSGKVVKSGELWGGVPAKMLRETREQEHAMIARTAPHYVSLSREYLAARG